MKRKTLVTKYSIVTIVSIIISVYLPSTAVLWTNSRWIVDEKGQRVKLACVNWESHLELVVAEGLNKQPIDVISNKIKDMGFNCVRLTWPLELATNHSLASLTVTQSYENAGLCTSIPDLQANNPSILHLSLLSAFKAVVASLGKNKIRVILDNHVSKPGWCCSKSDGNGFFGDQYFNPQDWINGLTKMATLFLDNPYVVGMSLRNELRGPRQNTKDWYRYMQRGVEAVHEANPNILVILSGLTFDTDLSFLKTQPLKLSFTGKLVYEVHQYWFSTGSLWEDVNANQACGIMKNKLIKKAGFLLDQGFPLFVSEWGTDMKGTSLSENKYLNCFLTWVAEYDLDWSLWTLVGSYAFTNGVVGMDERYGLLNSNWTGVRNNTFLQRISVIQSPRQGPSAILAENRKIIYHPLTGKCILRKSIMGVNLGNCSESNHWSYTPQKTLIIEYSYFCLKAQGMNRPARLSIICPGTGTIWAPISDSELHLAVTLSDNTTACLDVDSGNNLITTTCKCLSKDNGCDPGSQWFTLVDAYKYY
ncbi:glycosyl hydrolase 5 family protein-like [Amaranthus tricolor]|uniref:glycosyl hydrolase 5 family protein-like n=1 Tax=Amaranthus tricolor TaxID=29722 RepID=UPI00258C0BD6|nr:glycosyl hydrolase 5 family protein-like [Amaranthus tricolor]